MCGIVGYVGPQNAVQLVFDGLKKLEYRGYDSAGIAALKEQQVFLEKEKGHQKRSNLLQNQGSGGFQGHRKMFKILLKHVCVFCIEDAFAVNL